MIVFHCLSDGGQRLSLDNPFSIIPGFNRKGRGLEKHLMKVSPVPDPKICKGAIRSASVQKVGESTPLTSDF